MDHEIEQGVQSLWILVKLSSWFAPSGRASFILTFIPQFYSTLGGLNGSFSPSTGTFSPVYTKYTELKSLWKDYNDKSPPPLSYTESVSFEGVWPLSLPDQHTRRVTLQSLSWLRILPTEPPGSSTERLRSKILRFLNLLSDSGMHTPTMIHQSLLVLHLTIVLNPL